MTPSPVLTRRERDCLSCVARGLTMAETAATLGISPRTVEAHLAAARARLGADSTAQAIGIATRRKIIRLSVA